MGRCCGNTMDQTNLLRPLFFFTCRVCIQRHYLIFLFYVPVRKEKKTQRRDPPLHIYPILCVSVCLMLLFLSFFFLRFSFIVLSRILNSTVSIEKCNLHRSIQTEAVRAKIRGLCGLIRYFWRKIKAKIINAKNTKTTTNDNDDDDGDDHEWDHKSKSHITCVRLSNRPHKNIIHSIQFNDMDVLSFLQLYERLL